MPKRKKVILWGQNDLLTKAMEMLLAAGETEAWEVIKLPGDQCISALVEQMQRIKPDLVIIYQSKAAEACDSLSILIQEQPDLKMITVSLENNVVEIYSKRRITVHQASDLLSIIEDRYFSENLIKKEVTTPRKPKSLAG